MELECDLVKDHHGGQRGLAALGEQPEKHNFQQEIPLGIFSVQVEKLEDHFENAQRRIEKNADERMCE